MRRIPLPPSDLEWRLDPASLANRLTQGAFKLWPHIRYLSQEVAAEVRAGQARCLISTPPQVGKSMLVAKWLPVWLAARNPALKIGVVSYGLDLAAQSVRFARDQLIEHGASLGVQLGVQQAEHFEMKAPGAPQSGYVRAAGITGGITGYGFDVLIMDDLYANSEEAWSPTYRAKVEDMFWSVLMTRLSKKASVIGIMTRWHNEDIFGRLLDSGKWRGIRLPALADEDDDPLGRSLGDSICEEHKPRAWLEEQRATMPLRTWSALYQGRPTRDDGAMFRRSWWKLIEARPAQGRYVRRVRWWDTAGSKNARKGNPDFAVGALLSQLDTGEFCLEEIDRDRGTTFDCERRIISAAQRDGRSVPIRIGQEPGDAGLHYVNSIARLLPGWDVRGVKETGDKIARARPWSSQAEIGNVCVVRGRWNDAFFEEHDAFPDPAVHDDQVDACSGAFYVLSQAFRHLGSNDAEPVAPRQPSHEPDYDELDRRKSDREEFATVLADVLPRGGRNRLLDW